MKPDTTLTVRQKQQNQMVDPNADKHSCLLGYQASEAMESGKQTNSWGSWRGGVFQSSREVFARLVEMMGFEKCISHSLKKQEMVYCGHKDLSELLAWD